VSAAECYVLHAFGEFASCAFVEDRELAIAGRDPHFAGVAGADKDRLLGVLADVDQASGAGELGAELADVQVADAVDLRQSEKRRIKRDAVVEIKLIWLGRSGVCGWFCGRTP